MFGYERLQSRHKGLVMFLVVRTPRKTVGPVSMTKFGGHKRTTGVAEIATTGVFQELD